MHTRRLWQHWRCHFRCPHCDLETTPQPVCAPMSPRGGTRSWHFPRVRPKSKWIKSWGGDNWMFAHPGDNRRMWNHLQQLGGHCEIQRELSTDLHNTPIELYYVTQPEPHSWIAKCRHYEFTSSDIPTPSRNFWLASLPQAQRMQAITGTCARESCGRKFQRVHEMHIQHAGIKLSKIWTRKTC